MCIGLLTLHPGKECPSDEKGCENNIQRGGNKALEQNQFKTFGEEKWKKQALVRQHRGRGEEKVKAAFRGNCPTPSGLVLPKRNQLLSRLLSLADGSKGG